MSISDGLKATELECAAGRTAPRVSLDDIIEAIETRYFTTGDRMLVGSNPELEGSAAFLAMATLTVCVLKMKNGFMVIGKSAPASPENFDLDLGKKLAFDDAVKQLWPMMGFALRDRLAAEK